MRKIKWLEDVAKKDYRAAMNYLTLRLDKDRAEKAVKALRAAKLDEFRSNDILRAARLSPAPRDDLQVVKNLEKIKNGEKLSPVLLMNLPLGVEICDGYHRVSAAYYYDPDSYVPGRLA